MRTMSGSDNGAIGDDLLCRSRNLSEDWSATARNTSISEVEKRLYESHVHHNMSIVPDMGINNIWHTIIFNWDHLRHWSVHQITNENPSWYSSRAARVVQLAARLFHKLRVSSSNPARITSRFFFWHGKFMHMPVNPAVRAVIGLQVKSAHLGMLCLRVGASHHFGT